MCLDGILKHLVLHVQLHVLHGYSMEAQLWC